MMWKRGRERWLTTHRILKLFLVFCVFIKCMSIIQDLKREWQKVLLLLLLLLLYQFSVWQLALVLVLTLTSFSGLTSKWSLVSGSKWYKEFSLFKSPNQPLWRETWKRKRERREWKRHVSKFSLHCTCMC